MKKGIHPEYSLTTVECACGATFETRSTYKGRIRVDVCSSCHPFFTGKQKLLDSGGRIDRLKKKFGERIVLGTQKRQKRLSPSAILRARAKEKDAQSGQEQAEQE